MNILRRLWNKMFAPAPAAPAGPAAPPERQPVHQSPYAKIARQDGCTCGLCTGKIDPQHVARLNSDLAMRVDASLIAVSVGKFRVCIQSVQWLSAGGVADLHVIVCNDDTFAKIENALHQGSQ